MNSHSQADIADRIIERAKASGASLAGIAGPVSLLGSSSHRAADETERPGQARSILVLALAHPPSEPELDWWDGAEGGTPGNRRLMSTINALRQWLRDQLHVGARPLPYHVEKGGILLKDAAALAGVGIIGKNNLLITPEFGPRVRLRAMRLDVALESSGPAAFAPCETCAAPCREACPQNAFQSGVYSRCLCSRQMGDDEANKCASAKAEESNSPTVAVKYCRACELACPVAR